MLRARAIWLAAVLAPAWPASGWSMQATGGVAGVVRATSGQPIVAVRVSAGTDTTRFALSDSAGAFRLAGIPVGVARVHFRRLGFVPAEFSLLIEGGADMRVQVELTPLPTRLPPIEVNRPFSPALAMTGYYERQRMRDQGILLATFMDPEEIERRRPTRISQLFVGVSGLTVQYQETRGRSVATVLGRNVGRGRRCQMAIFIDGVEQQNTLQYSGQLPFDVDMIMGPQNIKAIEIYTFGSRVPEQFQSMRNIEACGSIVIWTKTDRG